MYKFLFYYFLLSVFISLLYCELNKEEGADCEWQGIKGHCVDSRICLTTLDERGIKQPICSYKGEKTIVCCTDCELVNDTSNVVISAADGMFWKDGRIARDHCLQYLKDLPHKCQQEGFYGGISRRLDIEKKCHNYSVWAVGGAPGPGAETPSENPYEALMGFGEDLTTAIWVTSGAIISERFILTSAHGHTTLTGKLPLKYVALGVRNRKADMQCWQMRTVKAIHRYPHYDGGYTRYNDISLLEVDKPIQFNENVLPACLPEPTEHFDIEHAKITSWTVPKMEFGTFLDTPRILEVKRMSPKECTEKITENEGPIAVFYHNFLPKDINGSIQTCYGNKDTCINTIGSPVVVTTQLTRCMNTVVGVNSYGDVCGPAVFTLVSAYVSWIESVVWP